MIGCVAIARGTGTLQALEWIAFDSLLQMRPLESADPQIVLVAIDERDIKQVGKYPIPDRDLAKLLKTLQATKPAVIGLDLFRDLTQSPERAQLAQVFQNSPNLIGIESALGGQSTLAIAPPPELPTERVGLVDVILDPDGRLRRGLLASKVDSGQVRFSMPLLVAASYLRSWGLELTWGPKANDPIHLGRLKLPRVRSNTGGYINVRAGGNQILLNFRSHPSPFKVISLTDVLTGKFNPEWIRDRIVLIGMTAASVNDTFMTSAVKGTLMSNNLGNPDQYQIIYGVEYQAHAISQLINAALHDRPLLHTWLEAIEYIWIVLWGLLGITLGLVLQSPWKTLLSLAMSSLCLTGAAYGLLLLSWWVPLIPAVLTLWAAGLTTSFFDRDFRVLLEQRSLTLKRTYDAVHNGPLQTLAAILRNLDVDNAPSSLKLKSQLHALNQELRSVYESMHQAMLNRDNSYAEKPIQDLLYEIYDSTLLRDLPGFTSIKSFIPPDFTPLDNCLLTPDQKQALCIFLQEAICNVGKHAISASYLDVICKRDHNHLCLQIIDNGIENTAVLNEGHVGRGTEQAKELARSLGGRFQRRSNTPQGTICELTWQVPTLWWQLLPQIWWLGISRHLSGLGKRKSDLQ
jgi:CHASE2 domain-containing sensor protein